MRLTDRQRALVLGLLHDRFGNDARVVLFGSRVRDDHRGGDIDLYVETGRPVDVAEELRPLLVCRPVPGRNRTRRWLRSP